MAARKRFRGQVVLVTGASRGIGRALALEFACEGATVVLTAPASEHERLEESADRCRPLSEDTSTFALDVTKPAECEAVIRGVIERYGRLDVLVNNAGVIAADMFHELPLEKIRWMIDVNVAGSMMMTRLALPSMLAQKSGRIVNIGSVYATRGTPLVSVYAATKAALVTLGQVLRDELSGTGVSVTTVLPSATDTAFTRQFTRRYRFGAGSTFQTQTVERVARSVVDATHARAEQVTCDASGAAWVMTAKYFPQFFRLVNPLMSRFKFIAPSDDAKRAARAMKNAAPPSADPPEDGSATG